MQNLIDTLILKNKMVNEINQEISDVKKQLINVITEKGNSFQALLDCDKSAISYFISSRLIDDAFEDCFQDALCLEDIFQEIPFVFNNNYKSVKDVTFYKEDHISGYYRILKITNSVDTFICYFHIDFDSDSNDEKYIRTSFIENLSLENPRIPRWVSNLKSTFLANEHLSNRGSKYQIVIPTN